MKVKIDPEVCIGCGLCVDTCPGVYRMEEDKAVVSVETVPRDLEELASRAKEECPVEAITIEG